VTRLAALLALLALFVTGCDDAPEPTAAPAPTTVPWWKDGVLHVGGATIRTELRQIRYAGGTTVVGVSDVDGSHWSLVRDGQLVPLVRSSTVLDPVLTVDGGRVVWVRENRSRELRPYHSLVHFETVSYDVAADRRVGTWRSVARVTCCDAVGYLRVVRALPGGSVVVGRVGFTQLRWVPGSEPVRIPGARVGWGTPWIGHVSPDGRRSAFIGTATGVAIGKAPRTHAWVREGADLRALEAPAGVRIAGWEDAKHVVVETPTRFLRCDATTGSCGETADRPGTHVRLPGDR
jgi:hypothetical protein